MSLQIFILGTLSEGDHHPYDLKKKVLKPLEKTISINDGTLYYNFEVLLKKGYIQKKDVIQTENRPEKTTYGITDLGRQALQEEIYAAFQKCTDIKSLYSSLVFLDKVDATKLAYLIEEAITKLQKRATLIEDTDPTFPDVMPKKQKPIQLIADHAYHAVQNDIAWLKKVLAYVRE
ncbi:DNA-binding PadR family transcriptional regulator [Paenibacillus shirakamiensis]|uniref:DNA-binding PadR family transcriptional regulator n=1 Tax=Paenibacillus shirakamiensis TaxID=1265935 RepID=A0ABS4JJT0_9BACL|nr:PadR family transcriptional regulator [Paenibacillus shirakamiensis]MBP2001361.1 DNA-binding PadR family transcriptional regulator [Paenibacillus shirakamiensis]